MGHTVGHHGVKLFQPVKDKVVRLTTPMDPSGRFSVMDKRGPAAGKVPGPNDSPADFRKVRGRNPSTVVHGKAQQGQGVQGPGIVEIGFHGGHIGRPVGPDPFKVPGRHKGVKGRVPSPEGD